MFRRKRNNITWIKDSNVYWLTTREDIGTGFLSYLQDLYKTFNPEGQDEFIDFMTSKVTEEDNTSLSAPILDEEIKTAAFQMGTKKAPGPD